MIQALQQFAEQHPGLNWLVIGASAALSWLAPLASLVAIVLGCLQIYAWFEKRMEKKRGRRP